jgi:hypothetical protein
LFEKEATMADTPGTTETPDRSADLATDLPDLLAQIGILATADGASVTLDMGGEPYRITVARA